jgi:hypothetical protein
LFARTIVYSLIRTYEARFECLIQVPVGLGRCRRFSRLILTCYCEIQIFLRIRTLHSDSIGFVQQGWGLVRLVLTARINGVCVGVHFLLLDRRF